MPPARPATRTVLIFMLVSLSSRIDDQTHVVGALAWQFTGTLPELDGGHVGVTTGPAVSPRAGVSRRSSAGRCLRPHSARRPCPGPAPPPHGSGRGPAGRPPCRHG